MKRLTLLILFFFLAQLTWAQQSVHDIFKQLSDEKKEELQEIITDANAEIDKQFFAVTHSQSSPQVRANVEAIAANATNSIYLIINIYDDGRSYGSVIVSNDLKVVYTPEFLQNVSEAVMGEILGDYADETEVFSAFDAGIQAFLSVGTQIVFEPFPQQNYGFDAYDTPAFEQHYTLLDDVAGQPYSVAWKSIPAVGFDNVLSKRIDDQAFDDNIRWADENQIAITTEDDENNRKKLHLTSIAGNTDTKKIYALKSAENENGDPEDEIVGQLNLISYDPKDLNVVLVPINGAEIPAGVDFSAALTKIFRQAVVNVHVTSHDNFLVPDFDDLMDNAESGWLADYTPEMRDIRNTFRRENDIQNKTYYVFVVKDAENPDALGFMPRARDWCFLYANNISSDEEFVRTMAHELGHGAYHLEHTFEEYSLAQGATENLMDYSSGAVLRKYQWDWVDDPAWVLPWSGGDDEGAAHVVNDEGKVIQIHSITEDFPAGIDDHVCNIVFNIDVTEAEEDTGTEETGTESTATETVQYSYLKLEIFKNGETTPSYMKDDLDPANTTIVWDGLFNQPDEDGNYIRTEHSPYSVKLTLKEKKESTESFEDVSEGIVHWLTDEWNDNEVMHNRVYNNRKSKCSSLFRYYELIRPKLHVYLAAKFGQSDFPYDKVVNVPLKYLFNNSSTTPFIARQYLKVHDELKPVLEGVQNNMSPEDLATFKALKYVIGGLYIRYQGAADKMSNHAGGLAIDIDHGKNPMLKKNACLFFSLASNKYLYKFSGSPEYFHIANTNLITKIPRIDKNKVVEIAGTIDYIISKEKTGVDFRSMEEVIEKVNTLLIQYNSVLVEINQLSRRYIDANSEAEIREIRGQLQNEIPTQLDNFENELDEKIEILNSFKEYFNDGIKILIWGDVYYKTEVLNTNTKLDELIATILTIRNTIDNLSNLCTTDEIPFPMYESSNTIYFDEGGCLPTGPCIYSPMSILPPPSTVLFVAMKAHYVWFRSYLSSYNRLSRYAGWLRKTNIKKNLVDIAEKGFFNLPVELVNYLLESENIEWGGSWINSKDFMHFEYK